MLTYKEHFGCWWLFWADGFTTGGHIYYRKHPSLQLMAHERYHHWDFNREGRLKALSNYVSEWLGNIPRYWNFKKAYLMISYEQRARAAANEWWLWVKSSTT